MANLCEGQTLNVNWVNRTNHPPSKCVIFTPNTNLRPVNPNTTTLKTQRVNAMNLMVAVGG